MSARVCALLHGGMIWVYVTVRIMRRDMVHYGAIYGKASTSTCTATFWRACATRCHKRSNVCYIPGKYMADHDGIRDINSNCTPHTTHSQDIYVKLLRSIDVLFLKVSPGFEAAASCNAVKRVIENRSHFCFPRLPSLRKFMTLLSRKRLKI